MNTFDNNEKQIKESLEQMPVMEDSLDKDILYQRISSELNDEIRPKRINKRFVLIPIFSTVMVLLLLVLIVPSMMNNTMYQSNSENSSADKAMDNSASNDSMDGGNESSELKRQEDNASSAESESSVTMMEAEMQSNVIHSTDDNTTIIHGALADRQAKYIIPLAFEVPKTENAGKYYNQISTYLNEKTWGVSDYMFSGAVFQLDEQNSQVHVELPEDFSVTSSTQANMFIGLLTTMFAPNKINKAVFSQQVNLDPIGKVKEISLKSSNVIYKRYQLSEEKRVFLARIPVEDQSDIETALAEMKKDEESYNVYHSIPRNIDYSLRSEGDLLQINFADKKMAYNNQETVTMIEAILMTAKSFDYQEVLFTNTSDETIGPYNLSEPIKVPEGVNAIKID
ncbi:hypothetical protein SAMN05216232_2021 [Virgibacillus subterraneus]|uniref:Sigma-X negative effector n=1 Tax=Virgibacillus subterraneus TaxID=621109 RepID=A0A1H9EG83_9BACI|nr:hypothetical protein [Virgibacillus subterraneus]SEQ24730.1 hypothetical protein SAMN05216232_2021 [Virgibacillus subterraneus]